MTLRLALTFIAALLVSSTLGCGDDSDGDAGNGDGDGDGGSADGYPPSLPLDDAFVSCSGPDDCVVVELGCCDECNGGLAVSVNAASEAEVETRFSQDCGAGTACTLIGCPPWEVSCDEGRCTAERGSFP